MQALLSYSADFLALLYHKTHLYSLIINSLDFLSRPYITFAELKHRTSLSRTLALKELHDEAEQR